MAGARVTQLGAEEDGECEDVTDDTDESDTRGGVVMEKFCRVVDGGVRVLVCLVLWSN